MRITLHYNTAKVPVEVPEDNLAGLIVPRQEQADKARNTQILFETLQTPRFPEFQTTIQERRLCVLLADATRDLPTADCLNAIAPQLKSCSAVQFILCTGTHTAQTKENLSLCRLVQKICDESGLCNFEVLIHDCQTARLLDAGLTSRGTHVRYNTAARDADVFLVFSDIKPHYFAGYSNPVKNFVPGICDYETARGNHSLTLDAASTFCAHPWHSNPAQQNQPLAADQVEAMEKITKGRLVYALTTISSHQAIQWAAFGPIRDVCQKAFTQADQWNLHIVKPVERLIISPGGFPNDMDLYIAQRALELTEQAVLNGGEILFVSACQHGIGPEKSLEHFWNLLIQPFDKIYEELGQEARSVSDGIKDKTKTEARSASDGIYSSARQKYKLFSHKPYHFARLIQRLRKLWVYSELPDDQIVAAHMTPADSPQEVIDGWLKENPAVKILIIDGANKLALRAGN
jgi:nickel-dependent lactate racemase